MRRDLAREAEIVRMYRAGEFLHVIGAIFGITDERVRQLVIQAGEPARRDDSDLLVVASLYGSGKTLEAIATHLECSVERVVRYMDRTGIKRRRPGPQKRDSAGLIQPARIGGADHAHMTAGLCGHGVSAGSQQYHQNT